MNDGDAMMVSPLSVRGEQRLQRLRASIKTRFGSSASVVRSLHMPSHSTSSSSSSRSNAPSPRSRLRYRLSVASQVTSDEIFFQEFGGGEELDSLAFDLAPRAAAAPSYSSIRVHAVETSVFESALPARSTAAASTILSQVVRPTRVRTPKKVTLKRSRIGESSAERAKPLQKPRLSSASSSMRSLTFGLDQPIERKGVDANMAMGTNAAFFAHTSPSKLHFPSASTRALFAQRSAPLR